MRTDTIVDAIQKIKGLMERWPEVEPVIKAFHVEGSMAPSIACTNVLSNFLEVALLWIRVAPEVQLQLVVRQWSSPSGHGMPQVVRSCWLSFQPRTLRCLLRRKRMF